jgi:PTS system nitrogen regulatory IIA component
LISPAENPDDHIRALECTARQLRKDDFCRFLRQAKNVDEIKQLLDEADDHHA